MARIRQRAIGDCGIVALSVALRLPYDDVADAIAAVEPTYRGTRGLHNRHLIAAAAALGATLQPLTVYDLATADGILRVRWNLAKPSDGGHFTAVRRGALFCPGLAKRFEPEEYAALRDARFCTLLSLS